MKINVEYSYEFNVVLNEGLSCDEQIKNFASLISDKDRFLPYVVLVEKNLDLIEKVLGFKVSDKLDVFVVRAEKFKSFSSPITIEYSIYPEEMFLFLLKEILKVSTKVRFPDEVSREEFINAGVSYIVMNGDFSPLVLDKYLTSLFLESSRLFEDFDEEKSKGFDFSKKSIADYLEEVYLDFS